MQEDWLGRWEEGRIGWHEPSGNAALKAHWPEFPAGSKVLVPFCGKSVDMAWLAERGLAVTGVELSLKAIEAFFAEQGLEYRTESRGAFAVFRARNRPIAVYGGDFFEFRAGPFDALFDRGALVALPPGDRPRYVQRLRGLLKPEAFKLLVTLEYDPSRVDGPPFAVLAAEVQEHWPGLRRIAAQEDIGNAPPKFREAGLESVIEAVWSGGAA